MKMALFKIGGGHGPARKLIVAGTGVTLLSVTLMLAFSGGSAVGTDGGGGATRTWVSGVGDDANPCSRTAPCKTWAGAISKTAQPGGEIDALDPGGFGAVTVTGGITLNGGKGNTAGVLVAGTNGIVVSAAANDTVILRNLDINGLWPQSGAGLSGIAFVSGKALYIEDSTIENFQYDAVYVASSGSLVLKNDVLRNDGQNGIWAGAGSAPLNVLIEGCTIQGNLGAGISAQGNGSPNSSVVDIRNNDITGNGYGLATGANGGVIQSFGGNVIDQNGLNGAPNVTRSTV